MPLCFPVQCEVATFVPGEIWPRTHAAVQQHGSDGITSRAVSGLRVDPAIRASSLLVSSQPAAAEPVLQGTPCLNSGHPSKPLAGEDLMLLT